MDNPEKAAPRWFSSVPGGGVLECRLCPHRCVIAPGKTGRCGARGNAGGRPALSRYGHITALALDPIEKKPLYHFRPGTQILSAGFSGCNMRCPFCQNWRISQNPGAEGLEISATELIDRVKESGTRQIAFTYSEPLIHGEFLLDCMTAAREAGIACVLVTNGCAGPEAAGDILPLCAAVNVDLKSFSAKTCRDILGGDLETVKTFIRASADAGVHVEITTLVVPGMNDSEAELDAMAGFIAGIELDGISAPPPWHLSAYHPDWRWDAPSTSPDFLRGAARRAKKLLPFVYTGNIPGESDTDCALCGAALVKRNGYRVNAEGLVKTAGTWRCANCGGPAPFAG